jgi:hypothetical protein
MRDLSGYFQTIILPIFLSLYFLKYLFISRNMQYTYNIVPVGREVNTIFDGPNMKLPMKYSESEALPEYNKTTKSRTKSGIKSRAKFKFNVCRSLGPELPLPQISSRAPPMTSANYSNYGNPTVFMTHTYSNLSHTYSNLPYTYISHKHDHKQNRRSKKPRYGY